MDNKTSDFFKCEYENIVNAHFKSSDRVTSFFRYILLIYTAPLILLVKEVSISIEEKGSIFLVISFIGYFIEMYLIQLRLETLLYARTVNGMRRYFYDMNFQDEYRNSYSFYNILPTQKEKPNYFDFEQFGLIVLCLGLINSSYLFYSLEILIPNNFHINIIYINIEIYKTIIVICISLLFYTSHVVSYYWFSKRQEAGANLYKHRIGVDIDGVLNEHEKQFSDILKIVSKIDIQPEQITTLPVRYSNIGVTENDERKVFETENYWKNMPVKDGAKQELDRINDNLGYEIFIITWRDWGHDSNWDIKEITKTWLDINKICYKRIIFEEGNLQHPVGVKKSLYKSRFYFSKKMKIKYFIEDDLDKALVLANICNKVFLIDHLYNKCNVLPHNVIRIFKWHEIFDYLKRFN